METGLRAKAFCLFLWAGIFKKERFVIGIVRETVLLASKCFKIIFGLFKHFASNKKRARPEIRTNAFL